MTIPPRTVRLSNGAEIPTLGLGVFRAARGDETRTAVATALGLGYRHVDTARVYGNERDVGAGLREAGVARHDVFVTTKLWNDDHGYDETLRAFDASLARLGLDYVDLYLIHWPVPGRRLDSWRALESLQASGRARAIGVSNYMVHHLRELEQHARVLPACNQIELSPFLQQCEVCEYAQRLGIAIEAYSPLTKGARLTHPVVVDRARAAGCTPAQLLLAWSLARGFIVLVKSSNAARLAENLAARDLALESDTLRALDELEEGLVTGWDPRHAP